MSLDVGRATHLIPSQSMERATLQSRELRGMLLAVGTNCHFCLDVSAGDRESTARSRRGERLQIMNSWSQKKDTTGHRTMKQVIVGLAGALLYIAIQLVAPQPVFQGVLQPSRQGAPGLVGWLFRASHSLQNYYLELAAFLMFLCLAIYARRRPSGWIFAFLSGWRFLSSSYSTGSGNLQVDEWPTHECRGCILGSA
jgi:hypothetical protein